jgi:DNA-binding response OmpR family regulator
MKILIVDNELYLAQSIANKLASFGYKCDIVTTSSDAITKDDIYDVVLLSTNIAGQNFIPIIHKYKYSIVILMVSYINNDTVSIPMKEGAKDYIVKPFMMEVLIRKINLFLEYSKIQNQNFSFYTYMTQLFSDYIIENQREKLPILIKAKEQLHIDAVAFEIARANNSWLTIIQSDIPNIQRYIFEFKNKNILYMMGFEKLKNSEKDEIIVNSKNKNIIISSIDINEVSTMNTLLLETNKTKIDFGDVIEVEEYIKFAILEYQDKYSDTELSKRLGISRKSLWEKRKKYDLQRKK